MLPFFILNFLKHRILTKTFFTSLLTLVALLIYLVALLGCISKGAGIENLYWVKISQSGTAGQPPVEVRIGYFGTSPLNFGNTIKQAGRTSVTEYRPLIHAQILT